MREKTIGVVLLSLLTLVLGSCGGGGTSAVPAAKASAPDETPATAAPNDENPAVAEVRVVQADEVYTDFGTFVAHREVTISTKVAGTLETVNVEVGSQVDTKTVIAQLDRKDYELRHESAKAQLGVASAGYDSVLKEYNRKKQLFEEQAIPLGVFEAFESQLNVADAQVKSAEVAVKMADKALKDTTIKAGVKGVVSRKIAEAGEYVAGGNPVVVVSVIKPIKLIFNIPERLVGRLKKGAGVTARVEAFPGRAFEGKVILISPTVDIATRTVAVEAEFTNEDGLLKPGFSADCTVKLEGKMQAFLVPAEALFSAREGLELRVLVRGSDAESVPVRLLGEQGGLRIVTGKSLNGGERVLLK